MKKKIETSCEDRVALLAERLMEVMQKFNTLVKYLYDTGVIKHKLDL